MSETITRPAYAIAGGHTGRERLRLVSRVMADSTRRLLDDAGVRSGSSWLDVGCGGGDVSVELARRVGAHGRVVGVDLDPVKLDIARDEAQCLGLDHVEYLRGDACSGLPMRMAASAIAWPAVSVNMCAASDISARLPESRPPIRTSKKKFMVTLPSMLRAEVG